MDDFLDAGQRCETGSVYPAIVADQSNGGALFSRHRPRLIAHLLDGRGNASDVLFGRSVAHDDEHGAFRSRCESRSVTV